MLNKVQEFFSNNFIGWLIHDWRVKPPFKYPAIHNSIHDILKPEDSGPAIIGVAADWATDTVQSEFIGKSIKDKNPDYTVHLGDTYFSISCVKLKCLILKLALSCMDHLLTYKNRIYCTKPGYAIFLIITSRKIFRIL